MGVEFDWNHVPDNARSTLGVVTDYALAKPMHVTPAARWKILRKKRRASR
jgi:hypothetical protein